MNKKIFQSVNREFIRGLFERKKSLFFPGVAGELSGIKIKKISPDWAKKNCLARYELLFSGKGKKIVRGTADAKKSKKNVWQIMNYLYSHGFDKGDLLVPKPISYIESINLLLYEEAPGIPVSAFVERKDRKIIEKVLKNTAGWLEKLHSLSLGGKNFPEASFLGYNGYKEIMQKIKKYFPELKNDLIPASDLKFADQIWKDGKTLIHNDFYPGNSISNNRIIFGIDFDRAGLGHYLMDIAAFYGSLEFPKEIWNLNISPKDIRYFQEVFLRNYCQLRELSYFQVKKDLKIFLVTILLNQIYNYADFTIKGLNLMNEAEKDNYILKIRALLLKTKRNLKNI